MICLRHILHDTQMWNMGGRVESGSTTLKMADNVDMMNREATTNHLRSWLLNIIRRIEVGNNDSDTLDYVHYQLDSICRMMMRCVEVGIIDERIVTIVGEACDCFKSYQAPDSYQTSKVFTGTCGRPKFNIPREQLEFLLCGAGRLRLLPGLFSYGPKRERRLALVELTLLLVVVVVLLVAPESSSVASRKSLILDLSFLHRLYLVRCPPF